MPKEFPFKIGADPEFAILEGTRVLDADRIMPLIMDSKKYKKVSCGFDVPNAGNIGWDGGGSQGELRPDPSNKPEEVVENMRSLFKTAIERFNIVTLTSRCLRLPVGGHVHLEVSGDKKPPEIEKITKLLSFFYLPLLLADDLAHLKERRSSSYGDIGDTRVNNVEGGKKTIEYRCPSAEWLTTPKIATATLAYLATVFAEIIKSPAKFNKKYSHLGWKNKDQGSAIQDLLLSGCGAMLASNFRNVKKAIKTFEFYPEYKKEIDFLLTPQKVLNEKKRIGFDIIKGWRLEGKTPSKRTIINQKIVDKKSEDLDIEELSGLVHIQGNDADHNIPLFISELKKRVLALGWKLKNNYFLFGIKKGIEEFLIFNKYAEYLAGDKLVKTEADAQKLEEIFAKMNYRFAFGGGISREDKVKPETLRRHILIGIPYEIRQKKNIKSFMEVVHGLEQGKFPPLKVNLDEGTKIAKDLVGKAGELTAETNTLPEIIAGPAYHETPLDEIMESRNLMPEHQTPMVPRDFDGDEDIRDGEEEVDLFANEDEERNEDDEEERGETMPFKNNPPQLCAE